MELSRIAPRDLSIHGHVTRSEVALHAHRHGHGAPYQRLLDLPFDLGLQLGELGGYAELRLEKSVVDRSQLDPRPEGAHGDLGQAEPRHRPDHPAPPPVSMRLLLPGLAAAEPPAQSGHSLAGIDGRCTSSNAMKCESPLLVVFVFRAVGPSPSS